MSNWNMPPGVSTRDIPGQDEPSATPQLTIHKFALAVTDRQFIPLPAGARILTIQTQFGAPYLWAIVDQEPRELRQIAIYGTGRPLPDDPGRFIATFQLDGGALVFHAFEVSA